MGKNDPNNPNPYKQQSVVIVPLPHPGVKVLRYTKVIGYDVHSCALLKLNLRMHRMAMPKSCSIMFEFPRKTWSLAKEGALRLSKDGLVRDESIIGRKSDHSTADN